MMRTNTYNTLARDLVGLSSAMDQMWSHLASPYNYATNGGSNGNGKLSAHARTTYLPMNIWSDEEHFFLKAFLPGVQPDDVEIVMEGDELVVRGKYNVIDEDVQYISHELHSGTFERHLTFNVPVDSDKIEAIFENGVLNLTVPKAEQVRPKQIAIKTA